VCHELTYESRQKSGSLSVFRRLPRGYWNGNRFDYNRSVNNVTTKAPEGAAAGVTTGGVIGGTLGLLAGVGLLAIPGLGPFIAAGPIMAGLAGLGVGGAVRQAA
jgi:hypothetical protein